MTVHRPRSYDARAICARLAEARGDLLPLWQPLARGGLAVAKVDGDQVAMVFEADAGRVADALDRALNRVAVLRRPHRERGNGHAQPAERMDWAR
jgi:acetoacetyl-CoA synthetase